MALGPKAQDVGPDGGRERQERIGYRSTLVTGEAECDAHMQRALPRLARAGHDGRACTSTRAASRSTWTRCTASPARRESEGVADRHGRRRHGLRAADDVGRRHEVRPNQGAIEVGEQVDRRRRPVGRRRSGRCSGMPDRDRHPHARRRRPPDQAMWTYWYLQEGEIAVDPLIVRDRRDGGAPPVIHVDTDAPLHDRRRRLDHRRAVGHLLQARPPRRAGRRRAARRSAPTSRSTRTRRPRRRPDVPGHVVRRAVALHGALRGLPAAVQARALGRRRRVHRRQLPGLRLHAAERLRDRRLEPRLQDDRRRPRGREGRRAASTPRLLYPFRFERFATGDLHPVSNSPYPWS